jgi:hypothetical protein
MPTMALCPRRWRLQQVRRASGPVIMIKMFLKRTPVLRKMLLNL